MFFFSKRTWKDDAATPRQKELIRALGWAAPTGLTKGKASAMISAAHAKGKKVDTAYRKKCAARAEKAKERAREDDEKYRLQYERDERKGNAELRHMPKERKKKGILSWLFNI